MGKIYQFYFLCIIFSISEVYGQDIHLSHIHASPTVLNPAMTGLFEGDIRFIANARSQWNAVTKGYKTAVGSMDAKLFRVGLGDFFAGGFQVYSDKAGDLDFTTRSVGFSMSYLKSFGRKGRSFFSFGAQQNFINSTVDFSKIVAFEQIYALQEGKYEHTIRYGDLNAGVGVFQKFNNSDALYLGLSLSHLNNPVVSFGNTELPDRQHILYRKTIIHGGAHIRLAASLDIKPDFIFMDQGPHQEITFGSFMRYRTYQGVNSKDLNFVYLGAWLRSYFEQDLRGMDAIILALRFDYRSLMITFSYDINISSWQLASRGRGGPEFSVIKLLKSENLKRRQSPVKCPAF